MSRVVLVDGTHVLAPARQIRVEDGCLIMNDGGSGLLAAFAPGTWSYYYAAVVADDVEQIVHVEDAPRRC